jgi:dGTPase
MRGGANLADYAMRVERSEGRRYPERPHPYRNEYERDRDRIVHSRAFRRLENKTQVFARRYSDHFRTRLTHTLEVAQISRTVAHALRLNNDLVEALALVHDVGHPPFGHTGETVLDHLMRGFGESFDHNLHALRIVEQLEQKYIDFPGLNLTFEVREGIIKHSRDYDPAAFPELAEYRLAERPPLEAQLIDLADEIAYNCADLDDGYESKLLTLDAIVEGVPLYRKLFRDVERKHPQALAKLKFNETLRRLLDALVTDLIDSTRKRVRQLRLRSVEAVRAAPSRLVGLSPAIARENLRLKEFLHRCLYSHQSVDRERRPIARLIREIFAYYIDHPRAMPDFYFRQAQRNSTHRTVCDYIAGMTDNYLREQHAKYVGGRTIRRVAR